MSGATATHDRRKKWREGDAETEFGFRQEKEEGEKEVG